MFQSIPKSVLDRMKYLELMDERDRVDGTPISRRLMQVPAETGKLLALFAASAPEGTYLEIGTSAGYSALWITRACELLGRDLNTIEILPNKATLARETFKIAEVESRINLYEGDARDLLPQFNNIAFCFLDARKEIYSDCYEAVVPKLVKGGLLIADNVTNFREMLQPMLDRALTDEKVDAMIVPIGSGELVCRKI